MNISVGEGVEDLEDEGVKREGVDSSLSAISPTKFRSSPDPELLSTGEKELNLKGGENASLSTDSWMLLVGVPGGVRLKVAG